GCNDDVNKVIWSELGWNPDADPRNIVNDYARFFIGEDVAGPFAQGLLALERNWRGPLIANTGVDATLQLFQELERKANPQLRANWRFQQALYRAYYDAFLRDRLTTETEQEQRALAELKLAPRAGALPAIQAAEVILDADTLTPRAPASGSRVRARRGALP